MTKAGKISRDIQIIKPLLSNINKNWDGKESILYMKDNGCQHWKQMEWIGFYFQFLCEQKLDQRMKFQLPRYGNTSFDALMGIPWDFKAHVIGGSRNSVITNASSATAMAIQEYGATGLILASGVATYDDPESSFKIWHDQLKGGISPFEIERINRKAKSRRRKAFFELQKIEFILITDSTLLWSGSFQKGFRNADGSPRREKVLLNLNKLPTDEVIDVITF